MTQKANQPNEPATVAIDPQVVFSERDVGPRTMVIAHHPALGKFFQLGPEEYRIARLLDGSHSITQIIAQLQRDGLCWQPTEVADLIARLVTSGLAIAIASDTSDSSGRDSSSTDDTTGRHDKPEPWSIRVPKVLSLLISQRIPLINGDLIATRLERRLGFVFSGTGTLCWCLLVFSGLTIIGVHRQAFAEELRRLFDPGLWLVLLGLWVVAKVIHEAGHAIAARYHGVHVGKIGIMFFFLAPLAYVDVTDAWRLKSRWSRVQIALGGVYLELAGAAFAAWAWWFLPDCMVRHLAAQFFLVAGPATVLVNANPLLRLDGYYVVSDLAEIPNMRMHGRRQLVSQLEWLLLRIPTPRPLLAGWRRTFATVHAGCSVVFQFVWMGGLILAVSIWAKGLGIVLALAALTLWALLPLVRWLHKVWMYQPDGRPYWSIQRRRLIGYASFLLLLFPYISVTDSPLSRRVPVVVQFREEQIARAATDAFVRQVYIVRGQRVKEGMLLMELENPDLKIQRDAKADDLRIAELRAVQFRRQGELSKSAAETENAESLRRQLAELDTQIAGLRVIANREGLAVGVTIERLEGRFVGQGEELLRVSDPQEKELLASVGESDIEAYQSAASRAATSFVRLRGGKTFSATPDPLRPRARRTLPHPALSASVGGPLPVEPSPGENQQLRVVEPQMESITALDAAISAEIRAGQIGTMTIDDNRSLVVRLIDAIKR